MALTLEQLLLTVLTSICVGNFVVLLLMYLHLTGLWSGKRTSASDKRWL
jgi:hypothetical protein